MRTYADEGLNKSDNYLTISPCLEGSKIIFTQDPQFDSLEKNICYRWCITDFVICAELVSGSPRAIISSVKP